MQKSDNSPSALRPARERLGLSRIELAQRADCSLAYLANIEQGAPVRRSKVLERAWQALREAEAAGRKAA